MDESDPEQSIELQPRALLVDDDDFARELMRRILVDAGIPVQPFASAVDLLMHDGLYDPCVLLLDVRMPGMSGLELQARLRERMIDLPIVFVSSFPDIPAAVHAMRDGAIDFLIKPVPRDALIDRVRSVFSDFYAPGFPMAVLEHSRRLATLTPREREVFDLMLTGAASKRIARLLDCSFRTVDVHRSRIMAKMAATSLAELIRLHTAALARSDRRAFRAGDGRAA